MYYYVSSATMLHFGPNHVNFRKITFSRISYSFNYTTRNRDFPPSALDISKNI